MLSLSGGAAILASIAAPVGRLHWIRAERLAYVHYAPRRTERLVVLDQWGKPAPDVTTFRLAQRPQGIWWWRDLAYATFGLGLLALAWLMITERFSARSAVADKILTALAGAVLCLFLLAFLTFSVISYGMYQFAHRHKRWGNEAPLGSIRSALSLYYGDMEGQYPSDLAALTIAGKYMQTIPPAKTQPYHPDSSVVRVVSNDGYKAGRFTDDGGWAYVTGGSTTTMDGAVLVNCTHTDARGSAWTSY